MHSSQAIGAILPNRYGSSTLAKLTAMFILRGITAIVGLAPGFLLACVQQGDAARVNAIVRFAHSVADGMLLATISIEISPGRFGNFAEWAHANGYSTARLIPFLIFFICVGFHILFYDKDEFRDIDECTQKVFRFNEPVSKQERRPINDSLLTVPSPQEAPTFTGCHQRATGCGSDDIDNHRRSLTGDELDRNSESFTGSGDFMRLCGLLLHEYCEEFAVRLSRSLSQKWDMLGAEAAHTFLLAFHIGTELWVMKCKPKKVIMYTLLYSVIFTISINKAINLTDDEEINGASIAMYRKIGCLALLYVLITGYFRHLQHVKERKVSFLVVLLTMLLQIYMMHEQEHGHGHSHA